MASREYRPFLGCIEEARSAARHFAIALVLGIAIPFGVVFAGIGWVKGSPNYSVIFWGVIATTLLAAAMYFGVDVMIRATSASLTLSDEGLVYQVTKRRRGWKQVVTRIQSTWNEVRSVREQLAWWGGRAFRLEIDTDQGSFSFRAPFRSYEELKRTICSLAPNLSRDDWADALPGFGPGKTFREYSEWRSWLTMAPISVVALVELVWGFKLLYNSGLPPELRGPMPSTWMLGILLFGQMPILLLFMTPYIVWLRNYLDVAQDGVRREQCRIQWLPPKILSTRMHVPWEELTHIRWIDHSRRGLHFDTARGAMEFGRHLSEATNREILEEIRRYAPRIVPS